jgi:glucosyl-3-phosphoglycerate synthase
MADFHQDGEITTLHALHDVFDRDEYLGSLEGKLEDYSQQQRISLLLPSLFSETRASDVLDKILREIQQVRYINCVVVALGGTEDETEFREAREYFRQVQTSGCEVKVIWVLGPRIQSILQSIQERQIPTGVHGKGQSVWVTLGYLFARRDAEVIALHDCDIVTYDRIMLGRLIEPIANPHNDFEFCKGFYPRISPSERAMKGRVTRLFVMPFVDSLYRIMYEANKHSLVDFFRYHQSFKYPLAGEFSFTTRLVRGVNIAFDWGLEVSTLSEVYNRLSPRKIVQIDLASNYEHKHQELSPEAADRGLHRMVVDIGKYFFNYLRSHGVPLDDAFVDMLRQTYYLNALRFIKSYSDDAEVNHLVFDRYEEELIVKYFRGFLNEAWIQSQTEPGEPVIPSWNRVLYSLPDVYRRLLEAVEKDND